jgi:signal transduction histidine kinase
VVLRTADQSEARAIRSALPEIALGPRFRGVASVLTEADGLVLDGVAISTGGSPTFWVRPLPERDRAALDAWLALLERRRNQLVHDLSGPATGVLAALETVAEYEAISENARTLLKDARGAMLRLTRILGDRASSAFALGHSEIEGPIAQITARLARPLVDTLDAGADRFSLEVRGSDGEVRLDAGLLDGALSVLLSNAWKFRRGQAARAVVECAIEGELAIVSVRDEGRGLDAQTLERAGELGFSARLNGAGLGLFVLRAALSRQGGALILEQAEPGLRATALLPLS